MSGKSGMGSMGGMGKDEHHPYKNLAVWQRSYALTLAVYRATQLFPNAERYGLTSQLRRAAISVPANIVEGQARGSQKEFIRFLSIARGSLQEVNFFLELARDLEYLHEDEYLRLLEQKNKTGYLLHRLMVSLRPS